MTKEENDNLETPCRNCHRAEAVRENCLCSGCDKKLNKGPFRNPSRKRAWQIIARHKWVIGALITESTNGESIDGLSVRRFTAAIRGWRNFRIYEGPTGDEVAKAVRDKVEAIRDRIDSGDKSVFHE